MFNYGLPYLGSKNKLAAKIIACLPPATNFYDVFAGGGAITHAAMLSDKYKRFYMNDLKGQVTQLFLDAIRGKYAHEDRWIDHATFMQQKEKNAYIATIWSFGNNGRDYMYSKYIEPWKHAYWEALMHGDFSLFEKMGINIPGTAYSRLDLQAWIKAHKDQCKQAYIRYMHEQSEAQRTLESMHLCESAQRLERLQSLERLERLQSLERLERLQSLERTCVSFEKLHIEPDSVIYCDPPYKGTKGYGNTFDYEVFYSWCLQQTQPVFVSEYYMPPDRFRLVAEFAHLCNSTQKGAVRVKEKLYTPIK